MSLSSGMDFIKKNEELSRKIKHLQRDIEIEEASCPTIESLKNDKSYRYYQSQIEKANATMKSKIEEIERHCTNIVERFKAKIEETEMHYTNTINGYKANIKDMEDAIGTPTGAIYRKKKQALLKYTREANELLHNIGEQEVEKHRMKAIEDARRREREEEEKRIDEWNKARDKLQAQKDAERIRQAQKDALELAEYYKKHPQE